MDTPLALLPALAALAFASSITPGPNNLMLMQSGMRFGLHRTLPHLAGVVGGFAVLLACADAGLGALVQRYPLAADIAAVACAIYLLWMATALLTAPGIDDRTGAIATPMRCWQAVLFQWVNPKAWSMAVSGAALMAPAQAEPLLRAGWLLGVYGAINLPCVLAWALLGAQLRRHLQQPLRRGLFITVMVLLLVATALWMLRPLRIALHACALVPSEPALALGR